VHPDKNSGERAHQAFQNLTKVYKILLDEGQRVRLFATGKNIENGFGLERGVEGRMHTSH